MEKNLPLLWRCTCRIKPFALPSDWRRILSCDCWHFSVGMTKKKFWLAFNTSLINVKGDNDTSKRHRNEKQPLLWQQETMQPRPQTWKTNPNVVPGFNEASASEYSQMSFLPECHLMEDCPLLRWPNKTLNWNSLAETSLSLGSDRFFPRLLIVQESPFGGRPQNNDLWRANQDPGQII